MESGSESFSNKSLHGVACRHFDLFGDVRFHFHDVRRCNVFFSHLKLMKYIVTPLLQSEFLVGFLFTYLAENWQHLKDKLALSSIFACKNRNRVLLTSELMPNI